MWKVGGWCRSTNLDEDKRDNNISLLSWRTDWKNGTRGEALEVPHNIFPEEK